MTDEATSTTAFIDGQSIHELAVINTVDQLRNRYYELEKAKAVVMEQVASIDQQMAEWQQILRHARDRLNDVIPPELTVNADYPRRT